MTIQPEESLKLSKAAVCSFELFDRNARVFICAQHGDDLPGYVIVIRNKKGRCPKTPPLRLMEPSDRA